MAKDRSSNAALIARGDYRPGKHAARLDGSGVPDVSEDARLWGLVDFWQGQIDKAATTLAAEGQTIVNAGEQIQPHPAIKIAEAASKELRALAAVLGIGALNRAKLGATPGDSEDDDDEGIGYRGA